jgi:hypothetical protein
LGLAESSLCYDNVGNRGKPMRLPEEKIKQAILHSDPNVREMAVGYFSESFTSDPTIMPLVIQAVKKYGHETFPGHASRYGFVQTDESLLWLLAEFAREGDPKDEDWRRYCWGLLELLIQADAHLLASHQSAIMEMEGLELAARDAITERIHLLSADPDVCWAELGDFCEREKTKHYVNEVNLGHANRLVEAIARHGERYAGRVLSILAEKIEDFTDHPMGWLEPLTVRLAGEMRLDAAIPLIVEKLHEDDDLLNEECERALWKIGTDAVVEAVCADYTQSEWSYRLYGAAVLECIHSDLTVTKALEFLSQEEDGDIRVWLGQVLLRQFASEGIEPLRQLILAGPLDPEMRGLRADYLTACTLMEVSFPEMERWREEAKHETEANKAFYVKRHPDLAKFVDLLEKQSKTSHEEDKIEYDCEELPVKQRVGRNDPCPCGSGKKFKKCCLQKQGGVG